MANVKIVTDSLADIPLSLMQGLDITIVPCTVQVGNKTYRDKLDLDTEGFYRLLASTPKPPTTSNPAVGVFEETYRQLARTSRQIISIHVASSLSGTFNSARLAAQSVKQDAPVMIEVLDSQQLSMALGWLVVQAARAAARGDNLMQVVEFVESLRARPRLIAMLDSLQYAQRSGRLGKAAGMVGAMLNVKPLLSIARGEVLPLGAARTQQHALERLVEIAVEQGLSQEVAVVHCYAEVLARRLKYMLMAQLPNGQITLAETGPVSGTHVGPGVVGLAWLTPK
ncbi:MAG: DegV family protein [Anaerolineales bacterium]|nr:DegV family protein [Anaerolineales bacterium]